MKRIMWVLAGVTVFSFVLWNDTTGSRGRQRQRYAGTIFGKNVSHEEFLRNQREMFNDQKMQVLLDAVAAGAEAGGEDLGGGDLGGDLGGNLGGDDLGGEDLGGEDLGGEDLRGEDLEGEPEEGELLSAPDLTGGMMTTYDTGSDRPAKYSGSG